MLVTNENYNAVLEKISKYDTVIVDVETNGFSPYKGNQLCGVGLGIWENPDTPTTFYFPIRHQNGTNLPYQKFRTLIDTLNKTVKVVVGFNIKFDLSFLAADGLNVLDMDMCDVIVMARMSSDSTYKDFDLTSLITNWISPEDAAYDKQTKQILKSNKWNKDYSLSTPEILGEPYCEKDVYYTGLLYTLFKHEIEKTNQVSLFEMQKELTKVLYTMQDTGVTIDAGYAKLANERILNRQELVKQKIYEMAGEEFNINSPAQIGEVFNRLGFHSTKVTAKGGKEAWDVEALANVNHPMAGYIGQFRALEKLRTTYVEPWIDMGVLHTTFCNWGTLTGRLSSREPNLQNAPRSHVMLSDRNLTSEELEVALGRLETQISSKGGMLSEKLSDDVIKAWAYLGDESYNESDDGQIAIRRLMVPRPGYTFVSFDYSQMEVVVFLSYLNNPEINARLASEKLDLHSEAARIAFGVEPGDPEFKFYRQMAKSITFGIIYGIGKDKLASQLRVTPQEADTYKKRYMNSIEGAAKFIRGVMEAVQTRGWVKNRFNRVYQIPPKVSYRGVNYLVQGTSADLINERLVEVYKYLRTTKSRVLLQVHDELILEIANDELETVAYDVQKLLRENSLNIPLFVDMEICKGSLAVKEDLEKYLANKTKKNDYIDSIDWS